MRYIITILLFFVCKLGTAQVYQLMPQYGYDSKRFNFDSTLSIPTTCGVPTLKANLTKKAAIAYDSCNKRFYYYDPKLLAWDTIKGGGTQIDTTSLSNRINLKLNITDTTSLLRKVDTTNKFLSSAVKLNDSTIRFTKGTTTNDITISAVNTASRLVTSVYNKSGAAIPRGSVVYIDGAHSSVLPSIALAKANNESTSAYTYGFVVDDIPNNHQGIVIQNGAISNLNLPTSSYTDGQTLYLSPTIAGGYTTTKPSAPNHYVALGTITRAHPQFGTIQVSIRNGFQLDEMSDVKIALVPIDSALLQFSRVDSLWHDVSVSDAMVSYLKKSDSIIYQTKFRSDTARINTYTALATKLNITDTSVFLRDGDSALYQTKFRSDTARTNIYNQFALEVNLADSNTIYQTKFRSDTARTNIYTAIAGREAPLTFSTGLTRSTNTITNNLSVGVSGGQSVVGGTASGNNLTLSTTSNATKGKILFGTSTYDEANNRMGIGTTSPVNPFDVIRGTAGTMARNSFESGSFSFNGDMKVGVYTSSATSTDGAALTFAQTNLQANSRYPGFDMQYVYSATVADNAWRLNYTERSAAGAVQNYAANLFAVYANGRAVLNPAVVGVTSSAKLFIGHNTDAGFMFDNNGTGRFSSTLTTNGNIRKVTARTSAYTALATDDLIPCDATSAAFTITLPTASGRTGQTYTIKKTDNSANAITIGTTSSQTIDGATTYSLASQWKYVSVMSNGSNWLIIANN